MEIVSAKAVIKCDSCSDKIEFDLDLSYPDPIFESLIKSIENDDQCGFYHAASESFWCGKCFDAFVDLNPGVEDEHMVMFALGLNN